MTHVVLALGGLGPSGITTYAEELQRALRARGHTVDVVVGRGGRRGGRSLARLLPRSYVRPLANWLRGRVRELRPDVVHVVSPAILMTDLGVPTVLTAWHHPHGFVGRWNASLDMRPFGRRQVLWEMAGAWPGYRLDEGALHHCDRVAAVSRRLATALAARGWPASFVPPMISRPESASPRTLPDVPRVVFSSANLGAPRKGLEFLVAAFERLEERSRFAVDLIGEPDGRARDLLKGRRISRMSTMHGRVNLARARAIMGAGQVLAMPSRSEEFGYVALEALALGLPVVAFDVPTLDEMVTADCGRRVRALDAGAFADALEEILTDPDGYRKLSEGALRRAQTYSPEAWIPRLETLYREASEAR